MTNRERQQAARLAALVASNHPMSYSDAARLAGFSTEVRDYALSSHLEVARSHSGRHWKNWRQVVAADTASRLEEESL